jgi:TetR/AcrR family transcriptional regulator, cholesterol catabolism regulator
MTQPLEPQHFTAAELCEGIFRRHRESIRIKNPRIAIPNLERILLAALEFGSRKGFHSTSTRDLATASGLSIGAIYNYVDGKETLLRMILGAVAQAVEHGVAPFEADEITDPRMRLRGLIRRHILVTEVMQRWFYFAFLEVKAFDRDTRSMAIAEELRTEQLIGDAIRAGIDEGIYIDGDPQILAGLVKPLLQDWYLKRWKFRKRGISPVRYIGIVTPFVERSLERIPVS